jgi:hypothetical protein
MVDLAAAIAVATQTISTLKELRNIDKALNHAEWKLRVAELASSIADLKNALVEAKSEVNTKDEEAIKLRETLKRFRETIEVNGYCYDKKEDGKPIGQPYCPVCIAKGGYMFHLTRLPDVGRPQVCPNCKARFNEPEYR